jgi:hypothetical protein
MKILQDQFDKTNLWKCMLLLTLNLFGLDVERTFKYVMCCGDKMAACCNVWTLLRQVVLLHNI